MGNLRGAPRVVGGTVYAGSSDGNLYAVEAATGEFLWRFETGGAIGSSPTVVDGTVYFGSADNNLYAVATASGAERWSSQTGFGIQQSSPAVADRSLYIGSKEKNLYAIEANSGEELWRSEAADSVYTPTVADETVYVGSRDGNLYAIDADSGKQQWAFDTGDWARTAPAVNDGTVYVGSRDDNLHAVDTASGEQQWSFTTDGFVFSSPVVADGTVYFGSWDNNLYAVEAATGDQQWVFETGGSVDSSPTVVDGTAYFGSDDTNLYAVNAATGAEQWRFDDSEAPISTPTVHEDTVYVGSYDNNLYAVARATEISTKTRTQTPTPTETPSQPRTSTPKPTTLTSPDPSTPTPSPSPEGKINIGDMMIGGGVLAALAGGAYQLFNRSGNDDNQDASSGGSGWSGGGGAEAASEASTEEPVRKEDDSEVVEPEPSVASKERIPALEQVASPPRRPGLSQTELTITEELGAGGQAIISKARLPAEAQPPATVALREPDTSATLTTEAVEEFLLQGETWATIDAREREKQRWADSEHIVGVIATGDRLPWLAMEYMDGGDLGELLAAHPDGLPVEQALWYGECICKGLEVAHQLGRAHLDVKPANVLLKQTDGWPWPKLADWGLSRTLAEETGTMEGLSVEYAGPEQFDSAQFGDPDQLTDIYQTGGLVYALLTGVPPATGGRLEVMKTVIGEEPITPPSERRTELPSAVDAAVGLALEREKTERYRSISGFGDALRGIRLGERLPREVAARLDEEPSCHTK